jgi:uncharacterized protein involved in exopolysaccharide biosynthesis
MDKLNLKGTLKFLSKYKKILIGTFILSAIIAAVISLFLPNYYKSQVLLLPSETNAVSQGILSVTDRSDPLVYGTEKESEYMMEMLTSYQIMEEVINKFDLATHYGINKNNIMASDILQRKLLNNIKVKRSDYLGVKLTVWDKDPKYAANIANYMVERLENLRNKMKQAKTDSILVVVQRSRDRIRKDIQVVADSISTLSKESGVYFPDNYEDRFAEELSKQVAKGNNVAISRLESKMKQNDIYGSRIQNLRYQLENKNKSLMFWDEQYEKALVNVESQIPTDFIVESAAPSFTKDKPHRSIIVLIAALCCTLLAAEVLIIKEKYISSKSEDEGNSKE